MQHDFKNAHILIIGDVMLDRYWSGQTSRISPEAPVPVVRISDFEERAAVQATSHSMLPHSVHMLP
ncbi:hypothetical protein [Piscirickettsia salmonis]|uniref:hypothetical protein n=1 Tax=Piscirickettsia salmonis TaxID=1238 RepID=UPI001F5D4596|nr:hypothetical protein [Piscirickettsia salmonis]